MKISLVLLALVLSTAAGFAADLPATPEMSFVQQLQPTPRKPPSLLDRIPWIDYSLYSGVVATHAADWASTEQCLRISHEQQQAGFVGLCHEALLPMALVESKTGLAAYETTTAGLEIYSEYMLTKHHHRRIARIAQIANVAVSAFVVAHNYNTIEMAAHP